jgi:hypothetical protein
MIENKNQFIEKIVDYFKEKIFEKHIDSSLNVHSKLKSYNINPIVAKYLSIVVDGAYTPEGIAKALYYPRVLGTSINTSFGTRIQDMFVELGIASGSMIKGMDIEFIDKIDGRKKWCQLKSGPNTINSEDVNPLIKKFTDTINLARTNKAFAGISSCIVFLCLLSDCFETNRCPHKPRCRVGAYCFQPLQVHGRWGGAPSRSDWP